MVKPFIPPLPSARPSSRGGSGVAMATAADQPPPDKENTGNAVPSSSSSFSAGKSAKAGIGSTTTSRAAAAASADVASSHSITEDLTGASLPSSTAIARTPARSALGRPPKAGAGGGSATRIRSSSTAAAASASASASASSTPLAAPTPGGTQRVLRYGETVESLFCLTSRTTDMHRRMCQDLVHGTGGGGGPGELDCAKSWRAAVEVAKAHADGAAASSSVGQNLIRLCRRATARFPLDSIGGKSGSGEHILSLWVLYAKAQSEFGTREEAKRTYWRIDAVLNKDSADDGGAADGSASFYLAMADFERADCSKGDRAAVRNAVKVLQTGLERGARPAGILQDRIKELEGEIGGGASSSSSLSSSILALGRSDSLTGQVSNVTRATSNGGNGGDMDEDKNDDDEDTDDVVFFKKKGKKVAAPAKRVGAGVSAAAPVATDDDDVTKLDVSQTIFAATQSSPDDNDATIALPANAIGQSGLQRTGPSKPTTSREGVSFAPGMESSSVRVKSSISTRMAAAGSSASSLHRTPGKLTARKDPALSSSRKPLLARKKIGGGAMRVTAFDEQPVESSDEDDDGPNLMSVANKRKGGGSSGDDSKPPPQKVSKMDIGYLLNWDPTAHKRKETEDSEKKEPKPPSSFAASKLPAMEKIEEESTGNTERSNRSQASNASSKSNHDQTFDTTRRNNQTAESHGSAGNGNSRSSKHSQHATPSASNSGELLANNGGGAGAAAAGHPSISPGQLALVAKSNADFLPLVSEDNIIRVNNTPFVKLGVIGRGGSCKVYRALSKECNVVAIKKVKLAGMDKKSINSYANEIRLLKSLRGNPAIIQLYDSEVDLQRKAIFLVMELGEVDLNHVLQQQALLDGQQQGGGSSCRNMNFIRLTWQQMLSAVHSIHEERIIHGDLKPANFLFVRGTLKLIDFGIAKAIQNDDTTNIYRDSQIGTLNYMSPESILDTGTGTSGAKMKCGRPSDVWALGCILYQMCYGRTPFAELRVIQKLQAIVNPNHEISFPDTVDEAAVDAIKLCIRRKAEDRAPIVGDNGLLNEHWFLHSGKRRSGSFGASNK